MQSKLEQPVLVLNRYYMAINVATARRAATLLFVGHAEAVEVSGGKYETYNFERWKSRSKNAPSDRTLSSIAFKIEIPLVIRLITCGVLPQRRIPLTRKNILIRDDHRCQYCGRMLPPSQLSLDHVVPLSRGGHRTWTNVVCACLECNSRKGGRNPNEAGMRLRKQPHTPGFSQAITARLPSDGANIWKRFLS